ncbi:MAG: DUF2796 domain-containing protein [Paracoccaceae bacterium]
MKTINLALLASVAATPLLAQETREMDAHVHGVSTLELAVENGTLEMNLLSPGMDIVGFEYEASTDADKDAVEAAIRTMLVPENIVTLPEAAECRVSEVLAHLRAGDHDHEEGEEHDHAADADHEAEEHAEGEEHDHEDGAEHSEFHVRYIFACEHPEELTAIAFPFFERFENATEIEAQYVTEAGAGAAEIGRDTAELTLN